MRPYKVSIIKDNYFEFITSTGIMYACYFLSYAEYFKNYGEIAANIFSFNVDVIKGRQTTTFSDERIGRTIIEVVKDFLPVLKMQ